jgi:hypothetical protein
VSYPTFRPYFYPKKPRRNLKRTIDPSPWRKLKISALLRATIAFFFRKMTDASFLFVLLSLRSSIWLYEERFTTAMPKGKQGVFTILVHLSGSPLFLERTSCFFFFLLFLFCGSEKNRFCISYFILVFSNGEERQEINLRNRRGCVLDVSKRRRRPSLSRFYVWRVPCR